MYISCTGPTPPLQQSAPGPDRNESAPSNGPIDVVSLRILHMNDVHGAVEADGQHPGLARASTVIRAQRAADPDGTLTLNAGDLAEGTMVSYLTRGEVVTAALNRMGFDAIELGNHDFAWGQQALASMVKGLNAPVLGANVIRSADGKALTAPYVVREVNGVKVGVIGVDTPDMERFLGAEKLAGLRFEAPADALRRCIPEVKAQGAEVIVVLSHVGLEEDKKLAAEVPGIDVIVGGHSHTELPDGFQAGSTLIVQAGSDARFVGEVDLRYDRKAQRVVGVAASLIPVPAETEPDPAVAEIVERYSRAIESQTSQIMGQAATDLSFSHREAAMLNQMQADSLLAASGAEIAVCSSRNLRAGVKAGSVSYKDLFAACPMTEEDAVVMRATGRMLLAEMEDRVGDGGRGILVPAGLRYAYDPALPSGHRVTSATLADGRPLELDREYTVVTTSSTERKKTFSAAQHIRELGSSQKIFMDFFAAGSPWREAPDDRVVRAR